MSKLKKCVAQVACWHNRKQWICRLSWHLLWWDQWTCDSDTLHNEVRIQGPRNYVCLHVLFFLTLWNLFEVFKFLGAVRITDFVLTFQWLWFFCFFEYSSSEKLFTDGSTSGEQVATAVVSSKYFWKLYTCPLPNDSSMYTREFLKTILLALTYIFHSQENFSWSCQIPFQLSGQWLTWNMATLF